MTKSNEIEYQPNWINNDKLTELIKTIQRLDLEYDIDEERLIVDTDQFKYVRAK